jgi:hypothetical protein
MYKCQYVLVVTLFLCIACETDSNTGSQSTTDMELIDAQMAQVDMQVVDSIISTDMMPADMMPADMMPADMMPADMMPADMMPDIIPDMLALPACDDGIDNDEDGLTDYPYDPACQNAQDDDEQDPEKAACSDEIDNDDDGLIDLLDPGCSDENDLFEESSCLSHQAIDIGTQQRIVSNTAGNPSEFEACRSNNAPEQVFVFTLRQAVDRITIDTRGSSFDTLLSIRRSCEDPRSELACNDDVGQSQYSAIILDQPSLGDYFVIVDGFADTSGVVVLNILATVALEDKCPPEGSLVQCPRGSTCSSEGTCIASVCFDRMDNDNDGLVDYPLDPGCSSEIDETEDNPTMDPECSDGYDNDFDSGIDYPEDEDCESAADTQEQSNPDCSDEIDNDGDGYIDLADIGCADIEDTSEYNIPLCRDTLDNDEDGLIDYPNDPGCLSREDNAESTPSPIPQCADMIDNDDDGLIDYPEDFNSCYAASDVSEDDPCARRNFREITGQRSTRGNTEDETNDFNGTCGGDNLNEALLVWRFQEDRPLASMRISTRNSDISPIVYVRNQCAAFSENEAVSQELFCTQNTSFTEVTIPSEALNEDLFFFIDSSYRNGIWRMQINARLAQNARCDGVGTWICDDGMECLEQIDGVARCTYPECDDGIDNNEDGLTDYPFDPGCDSSTDNIERTPDPLPDCWNNVDEDGDGLFDFGEDPDCESAADMYEMPACRDGIDNDGDGRRDFEGQRLLDPECSCADDSTEDQIEAVCQDQCDNDGDGLIDLADPGCSSPFDQDEFNLPACQDQIDNDNDGRIDYPNDPGCVNFEDIDETTPDPIPACGDLIDNDGDLRTDFNQDDGCESAADDSEESTCDLPITSIDGSGQVSGDTSTLVGSQVGSCAFGTAPEALWQLDLPHAAQIRFSTVGSSFNTVLYIRNRCRPTTICPLDDPECVEIDSELFCNRNASTSDNYSEISAYFEAGTYYVFVDGFGNQQGTYELSIQGEYAIDTVCDPNGPAFISCPEGTQCVESAESIDPVIYTCQIIP